MVQAPTGRWPPNLEIGDVVFVYQDAEGIRLTADPLHTETGAPMLLGAYLQDGEIVHAWGAARVQAIAGDVVVVVPGDS